MVEKIVCFHNPDEENGFLSNGYLSDFTLDGQVFTSVEQYMMFMRAKVFSDVKTMKEILATKDVKKIKQLGCSVTPYDDKIWASIRDNIVKRAAFAKFEQNKKLREKMLETGKSVLADCAVHDKILGIGISMRDYRRFYPSRWQGENLLGKILMEVRACLKVPTPRGDISVKYMSMRQGSKQGFGYWFSYKNFVIVGNGESAYAVPLEVWNDMV